MTTYVFLGPSLPVEQAARILDATYLPPIQQGDLLRLLDRNPRHVGIIDGYFEIVPAVWHKEILLAMSRGVHVFGAASMGALRAAELHSFGMVGVGRIFEWYRDGTITADDEVAVRHGPAELGYLGLSQALVDIRDSASAAIAAGVIGEELADRIVAAARALPYWERSYEAVAAALSRDGPNPQADAWLAHARASCGSLKARDAEALLVEMKRHVGAPWTPKKPDFVFEHTIFVERLLNELAMEKAQEAPAPDPACPGAPSIEALRRESLLAVLARAAAEEFGWDPRAEEIGEEAGALYARLGLDDTRSVEAWMKTHGITEAALWTFLRDELFVKRLARKYQIEIERELPAQLRLARARQPPRDTPSSA